MIEKDRKLKLRTAGVVSQGIIQAADSNQRNSDRGESAGKSLKERGSQLLIKKTCLSHGNRLLSRAEPI